MCDAKIRPFPDEIEIQCMVEGDDHSEFSNRHRGIIDFEGSGPPTELFWLEEDRRTFRGTWLHCEAETCILPRGHRGEHAQ